MKITIADLHHYLGTRTNGVWSHQVEAEYSEKFAEKLPSDWVEKLENINQIKVDIPVPNSVRYRELNIENCNSDHSILQQCSTVYRVIVFPTTTDFMSSLPPQLNIPEDNIWEVFVTVVRWFLQEKIKE